MMKDFFKKLSKPQAEVDDLDIGYDNEYYAGYNRDGDRRDGDRRDSDRREDDRPADDRRDDRWEERPVDRWEERHADDRRDDRPAEREDDRWADRRSDDYYTPSSGGWQEAPASSYRRADEKSEPVLSPAPAPEYLYFTPASYRDCREGIVKGLSAGHVVVVRLGNLEASDVLRLFDYMMGAVLALEAELARPRATTVVLLPQGIELNEDALELDDDEDEYDEDDEYEEDEEDEESDDEDDDEYEETAEDDDDYEEESDEDAE